VQGKVTRLALGGYHSGVLQADLTVVMLGCNDFNQFDVPPNVQGKVTGLVLGGYHSGVLQADFTVVMFGCNDFNQFDVPQYVHVKVGGSEWIPLGCTASHNLYNQKRYLKQT